MADVTRTLALAATGELEATLTQVRLTGGLALAAAGGLEVTGAVGVGRQTRSLALSGAGGLEATGAAATVRQARSLALTASGGLEATGVARAVQRRSLALAGAGGLEAGASATGWKGVAQTASGLSTGTLYTLRASVRSMTGATVRVELEDSVGGVETTELTVGESWTPIQVSHTTGAGSTLIVRLMVAPGQIADWDQALLRPGADPGAFRMHPSDQGEVYEYTVTRNLDGTGANDWAEGDALLNTGQTGQGFTDIYSLHGLTALPFTAIFNYANAGAAAPYTGGVYSANHAGETGWELFGDAIGMTGAVGDAVYYGRAGGTFDRLYMQFSQGMAWSGGSWVWEYWNGSTWTDCTALMTGLPANSWTTGIAISIGSLTGWATRAVNGVTAYWLRHRIVTAPTWTTKARMKARVSHGKRAWGPTIAGFVRTGSSFNAYAERWAAGNLSGLYDYGLDEYGFAAGSQSASWFAIDPTNGLRIMRGAAQLAKYTDEILLGYVQPGALNTLIQSNWWQIRLNTQDVVGVTPTGFYARDAANPSSYMELFSKELRFFRDATKIASFGSEVVIGEVAAGKFNTQITSTLFALRRNTDLIIAADATGVTIRDPVAPTKKYAYVSNGELQFYYENPNTLAVTASARIGAHNGGIFLGTNVFAWDTIRFLITGAVAGPYGEASETLQPGTVMFGRNHAAATNMIWDGSDNRVKFRVGTTTYAFINPTGNVFNIGNPSSIYLGISNGGIQAFLDNNTSGGLFYYRKATATVVGKATYTYISDDHRAYFFSTAPLVSGGISRARIGALTANEGAGPRSDYTYYVTGDTGYMENYGVGGRGHVLFSGYGEYIFQTAHVRAKAGMHIGEDGSVGTAGYGLAVGPGAVRPAAGDATIQRLLTVSSWMSLGTSSSDYFPTSGNWNAGGGNLLLNGTDYTSILFHDAGSRVDAIIAGGGFIRIGTNIGWGSPETQVIGTLYVGSWTSFGGQRVGNQRVRMVMPTSGSDSYGLAIVASDDSTSRLLVRGDSVFQITGTWQNISDRRIKHQIRDLDPELALAEVLQWRSHIFKYREGDGLDHAGFIADEMQQASPLLVRLDASPEAKLARNPLRTVAYTEGIPYLAGAIQAMDRRQKTLALVQQEELATLREQVTTLRDELDALRRN